MPYYICPNCKDRSLDNDGYEGFTQQAPQCPGRLPPGGSVAVGRGNRRGAGLAR